jgi:branched-subunit amino acid transport protein
VSVWIAVLGVSLGSFALRLVPLLVLGRLRLSARTEALIGRAGFAAVTALIAVSTRSAAHATAALAVLAAVAAGTVLAVRRASMLRIVVIGGAVYAAVRFGALVS